MKKQEILVLILVVLAAVLTVCFIVIPSVDSQNASQQQNNVQGQDLSYVSKYFDVDTVNTLNIVIDEDIWKVVVDFPTAKKYVPCTIELNGNVFSPVGMKTHGSSSLYLVANLDNKSERYSLTFNADEYCPGMTFNGLNKFIIKNLVEDSSFCEEYLAYELANELGLPAPAHSFVAVSVNGDYLGIYLMLESIDESFVGRNYPNQSVMIYRPSFLEYKGESFEDYTRVWQTSLFGLPSTEDKEQIVEVLKHLNTADIERYVDVESVIAYIATMCSIVNSDSFLRNDDYFLGCIDGKISLIPYDCDDSFSYHNNSILELTRQEFINFPIDSPVFLIDENGVRSLNHYPLLSSVLSNETYREHYHVLLEQIATEFLGDIMAERIDKIDSMIGEYVQTDPTKFVSYSEYKNEIDTLKTFGYLRAESILGQLNGTIPSTWGA